MTVTDVSKILFNRYKNIIQKNAIIVDTTDETSLKHLLWMCETAMTIDMREDKLSRWLGYVQGCLTMRGLIDVSEERYYSRALFHAAYGEPVETIQP